MFLTNGLEWRHYSNLTPGNIIPACTLSLVSNDPVDVATYLLQHLDAVRFWPEQPTVDTLLLKVQQLETDLSTLRQEFNSFKASFANTHPASSQCSQSPQVGPVPPQSSLTQNTYIPLAQAVQLDTRGIRPQGLRLPDGTTADVRTWATLLTECCRFALNSHPNFPLPLLDSAGRSRNLIGQIQPPTNISHVHVQYNGQTVYIITNYSAAGCLLNAQHVLSQIPQRNRTVEPGVLLSGDVTA